MPLQVALRREWHLADEDLVLTPSRRSRKCRSVYAAWTSNPYLSYLVQNKFQAKGEELASDQLDQFSKQLDTFTRKLEEFAVKHREEIRKNSQFRRHFQEMCTTVGVDPLACRVLWELLA